MLIGALQPSESAIPDSVLTLLGPRPFGYEDSPELFGSRTRPAFDELGAARTLSQMILDATLERERAARLVQFASRGADPLTLAETIDSLVAGTWNRSTGATDARLAAVQRVVQRALADRLLALAADREASPEARAIAELKIRSLQPVATARGREARGDAARAHWLAIAGDLDRWLTRRELPQPTPALKAPPGDPSRERAVKTARDGR